MCEPDPKLAVAAFRSVDFDYTRQLKSVWTDPHYHVSEINRAATDDIMDYFQSRMRNATGNAPLGRVLVGPAGYGKTHLIGELRRRVWAEKGWFVLLDFVGVKDFWSSVALGFLNSLQARMPDEQTQFDLLIIRLTQFLKIQRDLRAIIDRNRSDSHQFVTEVVRLFLSALARVDRAEAIKHRDVVAALFLLVSDDFDYNSIAHAWLQGMELDPGVAQPLGLTGSNSPLKIVEGLFWVMSLAAPTLIAIDQIDAIVSASNASAQAKGAQTKQEEAEAKSIVALLGQGLMDIYDQQRRAVTVVSCLEATWKILKEGAIESVIARYQEPLSLTTFKPREAVEALVVGRLAPAYGKHGFIPPYPSWPFTPKLLDEARNLEPRLFLKRCEDFRLKCVTEGRVRECPSFTEGGTAPPLQPKDNGIAAAFERHLSNVNAPSGEDALRSLLDATLPLLIKHYELPDSLDAGAQRDPDQKRPSLHGRVSFTFHAEGDREQHYCFRIIEHPNAIAFQSRLKAAMTASGIDTALKFRHLFILRSSVLPTGKKTETLLAQFEKAGGKLIKPGESDLRIFAALEAVEKENHPQFEAWLRSAKPLFAAELFKSAGLAPPSFLLDNKQQPAKNTENADAKGRTTAARSEETAKPEQADRTSKAAETTSEPLLQSHDRLIPVGHRFERGQKGAGVSLDAALLPRHVAIIAGSGSGKTVLLRRIVEEAALLGIPAIVLDINNDLSRLGDRWPERPSGRSPEDADRAETYHARADVVIWTPGANRGRPLSLPLLPDFASIGKGGDADDERELAIEMASATLTPYIGASGQKARLKQGVLADALRSFANIGSDTLSDLIALLSELPDGVSQIRGADKLAGDMADQLRAAVATNPLLRSDGSKLDPAQLFFGANGKTRISVISLCGLASDAAKQAFVNQLQMALFSWIKANPSESGLLYVMDEAQNFVPSQMGTPCKQSAKALAAQARKYGLGMILATQLPKGIDNGIVSNCTTHVYGRMNSPTAITAIEDLIRAKGGEAHDIGKLARGEFYFSTEGSTRPVKIQSPLCLSWHAPNPPTSQEVIGKARGWLK